MRTRFLLATAFIVFAVQATYAQYATDGLRFSQSLYGSTARFKAAGDAQIGVGGDLSSLGANPAGIGLFTRSEFSITPEFNNFSASSSYLNTGRTGQKDQLNLSHAGVVWRLPTYRSSGQDLEKGWLSLNVGVGYNRTAAYGNNLVYGGTNPANSIADYFAELATTSNGAPNTLLGGSLQRMAYDNYLIGYDQPGDYYFPETDVNNTQLKTDNRSGSQGEMNFSIGANYSNTLYVGASLGLVTVNYSADAEYTESGFNVTENNDYILSYRQSQVTKGSGINGKLGVIFRPVPSVRIGATIQTPTWYRIDDSYTEVLDTKYGPAPVIDSQFVNTPETYDYSYRMRTPMKASAGIGVFIGSNGFISADVDYIDYSKINFSSSDFGTDDIAINDNDFVRDNYKSAVNYRIGGELKLESLLLRAGYGIQGNPYKNLDDKTFQTTTYSAGLGYRIKNYYVDLTYQNIQNNSDMRPYTLNNGTEPAARIANTRNNVFMTVGLRF